MAKLDVISKKQSDCGKINKLYKEMVMTIARLYFDNVFSGGELMKDYYEPKTMIEAAEIVDDYLKKELSMNFNSNLSKIIAESNTQHLITGFCNGFMRAAEVLDSDSEFIKGE